MRWIEGKAMNDKTVAKKAPPPIRPLPEDVLQLLSEQAKVKTQVAMATELGISTTSVNHAVNDKFRGSVDRLCARVRGLYGGDKVTCPVLGAINTKVCLDQQSKGAVYSNPMRVALARACKTCMHRDQPSEGNSHE